MLIFFYFIYSLYIISSPFLSNINSTIFEWVGSHKLACAIGAGLPLLVSNYDHLYKLRKYTLNLES